MKLTEEQLVATAAELREATLRSLPEPEDCRREFSGQFERKMKRLIRRTDHPIPCRVLQRAAVVILILFLGFSSIMAFPQEVRENVFKWIREQGETFGSYRSDPGVPLSPVRRDYIITALPPEYEATQTHSDSAGFFGVYQNTDGQSIHFSYNAPPSHGVLYIDETNAEIRSATVNGNPADLYLFEDPAESNCIVWCDEKTGIIFWITGYLDADELITLAESVAPVR